MKGKDLNVEYKEETQEDVAKDVIERIQKHVKDTKETLAEAEEKLKEVLEKDINDIKPKDGSYWDW